MILLTVVQLFHAQAKQANPNQNVGKVSVTHAAKEQPLLNVQPGLGDAKASKPVVQIAAATSHKSVMPKQQVLQAVTLLISHACNAIACKGVQSLHSCLFPYLAYISIYADTLIRIYVCARTKYGVEVHMLVFELTLVHRPAAWVGT